MGGKGGKVLNLCWIPPQESPRAKHEGQGEVSLDDFGFQGFGAEASGKAWGTSFHRFQFYFSSRPHTFLKAWAAVGIVKQAEHKPCPQGAHIPMEREGGKQDRCMCHAVF